MAKRSLRSWTTRTKSPAFWVVTVGGIGMLRPAPGTWGSLFGLVIGYFAVGFGASAWVLVVAVLGLTWLSSKLIDRIEAGTGIHDAPEIVIDEVAGQWLAIVPLAWLAPSLWLYALAFLLFRLFDILKPWPIGWLDRRVGGGFGVMIDDLVAGLMAAFVIWTLIIFGLMDWAI